MRVVVAPDSFKGSASATEVAREIAAGWSSVRPDDELRLLPMADGGEGTLEAFELAVPGSRRMPVTVVGPDNRPVEAFWLLLPDGTGIVELANTSGLTLLDELRPSDAHTFGFGQAIADALDHGVSRLLLGLGGSASTDGGAGMLAALGARFLDPIRGTIPLGNAGLAFLLWPDLRELRELPPGGARILSDVTNPLLGPNGAAHIFGEQKGADLALRHRMDERLREYVRFMPANPETPGAGAAGGTGFGLLAWGAEMAPGSSAIGAALGLPGAIAAADVVITGEGRFDAQSAAGKVPSYITGLAAPAGTLAMLVAGSIEVPTADFAASRSLIDLSGSLDSALADPRRWLREAGASLTQSL